jgi:hypothetical protein
VKISFVNKQMSIMLELKLFLVALALLGLGFAGMGIRILLKKSGQFPKTHVGHNKEMRKRGIVCVKTWDKQEQQKVKKPTDFQSLRVDKTRLQNVNPS